jgi:hypothetical protein
MLSWVATMIFLLSLLSKILAWATETPVTSLNMS